MNKTNTVHEHKVKKFQIKIDDKFKITAQQIIKLQINRSLKDPFVSGILEFDDYLQFAQQGAFKENNKIKIVAGSVMEDDYSEEFTILSVDILPNSGTPENKTIRISFIDSDSYVLMNTYFSKGFEENKTVSDILKEIISLKLPKSKKPIEISNMPDKLKNFNLRGSKSLLTNLNNFGENYNFQFYHTRKKIYFKPYKDIIKEAKKFNFFYTFESKETNEYYYVIKEIKILTAQTSKANFTTPKQKIFTVNLFDLRSQLLIYDNNSSKKDLGTVGGKNEINLDSKFNNELKAVYKTFDFAKSLTKFNFAQTIMETEKIEILVPGHFEIDLGDKIEIKISSETQIEKKDLNIAGEWLIIGISDFYARDGYFMTKLTLGRGAFEK